MALYLFIVGIGALLYFTRKGAGALASTAPSSPGSIGPKEETGRVFGPVEKSQIEGSVNAMGDVRKWAEAIKQHEGWIPPTQKNTRGSRSYRNNNPGNLKFDGQAGATGADKDGFAIFPSESLGMAALERDLTAKVRKYPNYSLLQIMTRYLGGDVNDPKVTGEGDPFAYAAFVAKKIGASISDTLGKLFGGKA
jgi:hypothetical protein